MHCSFIQDLTGAAWFSAEPTEERPLSLRLMVRCVRGPWPARGILSVPGWIDHAPLGGWLRWERRAGGRLVAYDLVLPGPHGEHLALRAELVPRGRNPVASVTTVPGTIRVAEDREVARLVLRWDLRHGALAFVLGWRLVRG
ncbi:MAG: hypothetical protein JW751_27395 [Polyangiaceae bacterium]|nr:hypothetical protein [Polyangiaceae bacterium]